ncbi:MAG: class I SAM-dependent methyltransferase [Pseudonocardia sp.]
MADDTWSGSALAGRFADDAYATVKGRVRTEVMHRQLLEHLPPPPAPVLDVGGGAGHQSFPLAEAGYDVTLLDPSQAMLDKAGQRLARLSAEARRRVELVAADGENADEAVGGRRFAAVLCHGVLGYLERPEPLLDQLCRCAAAGGVVSVMTGNAETMAVRPAWSGGGPTPWRPSTSAARSACSACPGGPTRWRSSASACGSGAWIPCAGTGCGCSWTGSGSPGSSWTPATSSRWRRRSP